MKTLIIALAVTAILVTSAVAKTQRTKEVRIQQNNSMSRNSVVQLNDSYCRFHNGQTDPDPRVRLQLVRDCKIWETSGSN